MPAAPAGLGIDQVAGTANAPVNEIDAAPTNSNPSGNAAPRSAAAIVRTSTGTVVVALPAFTSSRWPLSPFTDPPSGPITATSCTASSGARSSTVITPWSRDSASNERLGPTGNPAAITGSGPPGI